MGSDPILETYVFESVQLTERLEEILIEGEQLGGFNAEHINEVFRIMHTLKGSAAMMEFDAISTLAHSLEDIFYYIRENADAKPDWSTIADICLESGDFIKGEVAKIQAGLPSDGDNSVQLDKSHAYMKILKGESEAAAPAPAAAPEATAPTATAAYDGKTPNLVATVFFQDGCKMENIRAFQIVNALQDVCEFTQTTPPDLLEDCSDEIINSGVTILMTTQESLDGIRSIINESIFIKTYTLEEVQAVVPEAIPEPTPTPVAVAAPKPVAPPAAPKAPAAPPLEVKTSVINVNVEKLDKLMDLMGEIVISVAMVIGSPDLQGLKIDNFEKSASQLLKNTNELQNVIMSVRMIPISSTFHKMTRIVRDTAKKLNKDVELTILGEETEVDKNIIDNLSDPLMHIVRNSMDHGIEETKEDREAAGKALVGNITLEARNSGSDVIISCTDDGRGLDRERILQKASANGMLSRPENDYSDKEVFQFIMLPGFSTNEAVTELSGRGVGMDVVKKNIEKIGGTVQLDSVWGKGMTVTIRIPLTLAILQSIEIKVGNNHYLIPTLSIRESFKPNPADIIVDPDGHEMILFRGEAYSIVRLSNLFCVSCNAEEFQDGIMIMVEDENHMVGVFADELVSEQQAVVKPIPSFITERIGTIRGISGCTIMGNGNIDLIIDIKSLTSSGVRGA